MHSLVLSSFFAAFLFTCVVDGSMSALPAPNLRSSYKKKKNPSMHSTSQAPHCWSKHRQGCDIAWPLCDYLMAGIKDEVAGCGGTPNSISAYRSVFMLTEEHTNQHVLTS